MGLARKKAYARYLDLLDALARAPIGVETFFLHTIGSPPDRIPWELAMKALTLVPVHVTVAVLPDGRYAVGTAVASPLDVFSKSRGHTISTGRALKHAARYAGLSGGLPRLSVQGDPPQRNRELRTLLEPIAAGHAVVAVDAARERWRKKNLRPRGPIGYVRTVDRGR